MIASYNIPCPVCQTKIPFDPPSLIRGHKFSCPNCFAAVGIAHEALETASHTFERYEELKQHVLGAKKNKLNNKSQQ